MKFCVVSLRLRAETGKPGKLGILLGWAGIRQLTIRPDTKLYLPGTYFNMAVVQVSDAMVYLIMVIAQHPVYAAPVWCGAISTLDVIWNDGLSER